MEDEEKCVSVVAPSKVREELEIEASDVVEKTDAGHKRVKEPKWPTSWLWQFSVLSVRTFRQSRHIILSKTNLIQTIAISIIASLIWFQTPMTEAGINNIFGLVTNFLSLSHLLFFSILLPTYWLYVSFMQLFFFATYWGFHPLFSGLFACKLKLSIFIFMSRIMQQNFVSVIYVRKIRHGVLLRSCCHLRVTKPSP